MIIEVRNSKWKFRLEFYGKYNVLQGLSGVHKSHLIKLIARAKKGVSTISCRCINDEGVVVPLSKILCFYNQTEISGDYHDLFAMNSGGFIVIDEGSELMQKKDIGQVLKDTQNHVLIIGRCAMPWLPISVDSIYSLQYINSVFVNKAMFCEKNSDLITKKPFKFILTEDSGSGRDFFLAHFPNKEVCTKYFYKNSHKMNRDNSQLNAALLFEILNGKKDILVVFDASAFGAYYDLLKEVIDSNPAANVHLLSWESFEHYILGSSQFNINLQKQDVSWRYNSIEQLSTKTLKELNDGYSKSYLPNVFKEPRFLYGYLKEIAEIK